MAKWKGNIFALFEMVKCSHFLCEIFHNLFVCEVNIRNIKPILINFNIRFGNINMSTEKLYITIQKRKVKCVL